MRFTEEEYQRLKQRRESWKDMPKGGNSPAKPAKPAKPVKPRKGDPEHQEQRALIEWCDLMGHPFNRLFAIPNGGGRSKMEAGKLRAEGVKAGVPDLLLPVPSGPYHGLFIEMKAENGSLRMAQAESLDQLAAVGYYCVVAYGWEQAAEVLTKYVTDAEWLPPMPTSFHRTRQTNR